MTTLAKLFLWWLMPLPGPRRIQPSHHRGRAPSAQRSPGACQEDRPERQVPAQHRGRAVARCAPSWHRSRKRRAAGRAGPPKEGGPAVRPGRAMDSRPTLRWSHGLGDRPGAVERRGRLGRQAGPRCDRNELTYTDDRALAPTIDRTPHQHKAPGQGPLGRKRRIASDEYARVALVAPCGAVLNPLGERRQPMVSSGVNARSSPRWASTSVVPRTARGSRASEKTAVSSSSPPRAST